MLAGLASLYVSSTFAQSADKKPINGIHNQAGPDLVQVQELLRQSDLYQGLHRYAMPNRGNDSEGLRLGLAALKMYEKQQTV